MSGERLLVSYLRKMSVIASAVLVLSLSVSAILIPTVATSNTSKKIELALPVTDPLSDMSIILNLMVAGNFSAEEGLYVELRSFMIGSMAIEALAKGEVDVAVVSCLDVLKAIEDGINIRVFMVISNSTPYPGLVAPREIKSFLDLAELPIAVSNIDYKLYLGPSWSTWFPYVKPPVWKPMDPLTDRISLLLKGEIKAAALPIYYALDTVERYPETLHIVPGSDPAGTFKLGYWGLVLAVSTKLLEDINVMTDLTRAVLRTMEAVYRDRELWTTLVLKVKPEANREVLQEMWEPVRRRLVLKGMLSAASFTEFVKKHSAVVEKHSFNGVVDLRSKVKESVREGMIEDAFDYIIDKIKDLDVNVSDDLKELSGNLSEIKDDLDEIKKKLNEQGNKVWDHETRLSKIEGGLIFIGVVVAIIEACRRWPRRKQKETKTILTPPFF